MNVYYIILMIVHGIIRLIKEISRIIYNVLKKYLKEIDVKKKLTMHCSVDLRLIDG